MMLGGECDILARHENEIDSHSFWALVPFAVLGTFGAQGPLGVLGTFWALGPFGVLGCSGGRDTCF